MITWIVTTLVAAVFTVSGIAKSTLSRTRLIETGQTGIAPFPMPVVRLIAVCELLAVIGLYAPWLSDTARFLTPTAAAGLTALMIGAAISHASLKEPRAVATNVILLTACTYLATIRFAAL
jgi:uncharacterized membrane protein YphA (DoxX/SURF4 family)